MDPTRGQGHGEFKPIERFLCKLEGECNPKTYVTMSSTKFSGWKRNADNLVQKKRKEEKFQKRREEALNKIQSLEATT